MAEYVSPPHINSIDSPRNILAADFKSLGGELPIHGGWGYSIEDAVIIDKNEPVVPKGQSFYGLEIERIFVEKRICEELIIFRDKHDRYSNIKWYLLKQSLIHRDGRSYDCLTYEVSAFPDKDFEELKREWDHGRTTDTFDVEAHYKKAESKRIRYVAEYWFDITSFYRIKEREISISAADEKELLNNAVDELIRIEQRDPFVADHLNLLRNGYLVEGMATDFLTRLDKESIFQDLFDKYHTGTGKYLYDVLYDGFYKPDKYLASCSNEELIQLIIEELRKLEKEDSVVAKCMPYLRSGELLNELDDLRVEFRQHLCSIPKFLIFEVLERRTDKCMEEVLQEIADIV